MNLNSTNSDDLFWEDLDGFDRSCLTSDGTDCIHPRQEWTDQQCLAAVSEIIAKHSLEDSGYDLTDAHWTADVKREAMVLADDREQYVIPFSNIPSAKKLHFWVDHLSCKPWVGKEMLEELVLVWQAWHGQQEGANR